MTPKKFPAARLTGFFLVTAVSFFTYFRHYQTPAAVFWDENYHIASAQKYLNHVFFMEPHPPLGKLLVALGEKLFHPNLVDNEFIGTDYAKNFSPGFSFKGYRFFSALLGWLGAPIFFGILLVFTESVPLALLGSCLYVFDNALIVHLRGAMIEGPLLFLLLLMILGFAVLSRWERGRGFQRMIWGWGVVFGLLMATKLTGLIAILLLPALWWVRREKWSRMMIGSFWFVVGATLSFVGIWQIHFQLARDIRPELSHQGFYSASQTYQNDLKTHHLRWQHFPVYFMDGLRYTADYNEKVPHLNLCKEGENGSPFYLWPFGARAINYRWETPNNHEYLYLYLQCNPVTWLCGIVGIVVAAVMIGGYILLPGSQKPKHFETMILLLSMYAGYMVVMSRIPRVMYLYHYFIPLLFSFILFVLVADALRQIAGRSIQLSQKLAVGIMLASVIVLSYQWYSPFTYYRPIDDDSFRHRMIFSFWDLKYIRYPHSSKPTYPASCTE